MHEGITTVPSCYVPTPPFRAFMADESPLIAVRAANGAGKSLSACHKLARNAIENPGTRHRLVGPTAGMRRETTDAYLAEILRPYLSSRSRYFEGTGWNLNSTIVLANGSKIELKAYSDPPQGQEGTHHLYTTVLDEVPTRAHYMANKGRAKQLIVCFTVQSKTPPDWLREEIEGKGSKSPLEGRTEHKTGWIQYVIPFTRENVPFYSDDEYDSKAGKYLGTEEEARRIWAAWESASQTRIFQGWHQGLVKTRDEILRLLGGGDKRIPVPVLRYSVDWGEGVGKQCQYLTFYDSGRFFVVHEWVSDGGHTPRHCAEQLKVALTEWVGPWPASLVHLLRQGDGTRPDSGIWGDINSGGISGAGLQVNIHLENCIRALAARSTGPGSQMGERLRVRTPSKKHGMKEAREIFADVAMHEGRFFVHDQCERLIRACRQYEGGDRDPNKDPIDACLYGIQDLLVDTRSVGPTNLRR